MTLVGTLNRDGLLEYNQDIPNLIIFIIVHRRYLTSHYGTGAALMQAFTGATRAATAGASTSAGTGTGDASAGGDATRP